MHQQTQEPERIPETVTRCRDPRRRQKRQPGTAEPIRYPGEARPDQIATPAAADAPRWTEGRRRHLNRVKRLIEPLLLTGRTFTHVSTNEA